MYLSDVLPPQPFEMNLVGWVMLIRYLAGVMVFILRPCTGFGKQVKRLLYEQFKAVYAGQSIKKDSRISIASIHLENTQQTLD